MKKILMGLLLAACLPLTAVAGVAPNAPDAEGMPHFKRHHAHKMERMAKELGLTAEQKTQVGTIFEEQKTKFQAIHEETQNRLKAVLSPEQLKKFEDLHPPRHMMPPPPPKPE